jgi:hypothetical protein
MKNLLLAAAMITGASLYTSKTEAQVSVHVNLNIGRPSWGIPGRQMGNFYYLPEIDAYYDLQRTQFVYSDRGQWIYASQLPAMYRNYDLVRGYKVFVNEPRPFVHADVYRKKYARYYNTYRPPVAMNRHDNRFDRDRNNQHFDNKRFEDKKGHHGKPGRG